MVKFFTRLGILPYLAVGIGLLLLGLLALNHITENMWAIDVERLDLIRLTAQDQAVATTLMRSATLEIVFAFLAAALICFVAIRAARQKGLSVSHLSRPRRLHMDRNGAHQPHSGVAVVDASAGNAQARPRPAAHCDRRS